MFENGGTHDGGFSFPAVAFGLGADGGAINVSAPQDSDKGLIVDAVLRGAVRLPVGFISGEVTSGVATGPGGPIQFGSAGMFFGGYIVDVGYSYAFPFAPAQRPAWLSAGMFSVRVQIPLDVYGSGSDRARATNESARAR
jgi:hypothetical protein